MSVFRTANKSRARIVISLVGDSGSGKTYTALRVASGMASAPNKIFVLDADNGRADLLVDIFGNYQVADVRDYARIKGRKPFHPYNAIEMIDAAKAEGKTNGKNGNGNGAGAAQAQGATALTLAAQGKTCGDKPCSDKTGADKVAAKNADADKPDSANPVEEQAAAIKALPGGPASAKPGAASAVILHPSGKGQA